MAPEVFTQLFWEAIEQSGNKYALSYNSKRKYTVIFTDAWQGGPVPQFEPIIASNTYHFLIKLREKIRELTNCDLYNYAAVMDGIEDYIEYENLQQYPDLGLSMENIADHFIDELEDGSHRYYLRIANSLVVEEDNSDTDSESVYSRDLAHSRAVTQEVPVAPIAPVVQEVPVLEDSEYEEEEEEEDEEWSTDLDDEEYDQPNIVPHDSEHDSEAEADTECDTESDSESVYSLRSRPRHQKLIKIT